MKEPYSSQNRAVAKWRWPVENNTWIGFLASREKVFPPWKKILHGAYRIWRATPVFQTFLLCTVRRIWQADYRDWSCIFLYAQAEWRGFYSPFQGFLNGLVKRHFFQKRSREQGFQLCF